MATYAYVAVTNIPIDYHAADLRAHFSSLVETKSFLCFHFRHRPEKNFNSDPTSTEESTEPVAVVKSRTGVKRCCVVKVVKSKLQQVLRYNGNNWTNADGDTSEFLCAISAISLRTEGSTDDNSDLVSEGKLREMPELNPSAMMPNGNVGTPTLVFLDMIQQCLLPQTFVKKLQLQFPKTQGKRLYGNVDFDYHTQDSDAVCGVQEQESWCPVDSQRKLVQKLPDTSEPKPVYSSREKLCETPDDDNSCGETVNNNGGSPSSSICVKLTHNSVGCAEKPTGSTTSDSAACSQKTAVAKSVDSSQKIVPKSVDSLQKIVPKSVGSSESGDSSAPPMFLEPPEATAVKALSARERKRRERADRRETRRLMDEGIEERLMAVERRYHNDADAEEWDRHEASEDDPSSQERNTERLYETEEETPWEKGGPGLVWYTDAAFWRAREGDFDEQTTDDLDVDFSAYEGEAGAGDKDIKDFLKIRQEQRYRSGYDSTDRFSIGIAKPLKPTRTDRPSGREGSASRQWQDGGGASEKAGSSQPQPSHRIGQFEQHSKGVGRKVMERQGWQDGQGLGGSRSGIAHALKAQGQGPHNKRGLGYTEPAVPTFQAAGLAPVGLGRGRKRRPGPCLISTVYDDPRETDPKVPLLQRAEPTALKHRGSTSAS